MTKLRDSRRCSFYICGKCNGDILYETAKGIPKVCPECGYGHKTRDVNDVPSTVRLDLNRPNL